MNKHKMLPIGIENFEEMVTKNFWYADKTLMIKDLLDGDVKVQLITRPRRFGKTLNMSMLQHFFDCTMDSRALFKDLAIGKAGDEYLAHMNQYPVIFLTFKRAKKLTFEEAIEVLLDELGREFRRHQYLANSDKVDSYFRKVMASYFSPTAKKLKPEASLHLLCEALHKHWGKKAIILLDEYDVPLESSYSANEPYYNKMISFFRRMMGDALKGNSSLEFGVVTGCLRISKESIFTGLNNLEVNTILDNGFSRYFGITEDEMAEAIEEFGLEQYREGIQKWYNGYIFGQTNVYNPWSVINYIKSSVYDNQPDFVSFWANTSGNDIVKKLWVQAGNIERDQIETLLQGGVITKKIHTEVTFQELYNTVENIWNLLFFTGYLKKADTAPVQADGITHLIIPNEEVKYIYLNTITSWFDNNLKESKHSAFIKALLESDTKMMAIEINRVLLKTISFMDKAENFYHGFLTGLLASMGDDYSVKSNRETGNGRSDIMVYSTLDKSFAAILELKTAPDLLHLSAACDAALTQISEKNYAAELHNLLFTDIHKFGIAFCGKECAVKMAE
ncbi:MAG: ATP-binding protein [Spirochaetaceae bacterium]|jgi:hypothetical protein|nr:ATP-binding protein [Spirochaetaceae bacterium]